MPQHGGMTASILTCQRVTCQEAWSTPFWKGIVDDYAREVSYPDLPADPNWDRYLELEAAGILRPIGLFDGDRLVGFATYLLYELPHFKGTRLASCEGIFAEPDVRKRGGGIKLIRALFRAAKEDGAHGIFLGAKAGTAAAKVYERLAEPMNVLFWRKL